MRTVKIRFSLQRAPQHLQQIMAPIPAALADSQEHLTLNHKLRKPLVEKLRRERINSSIEQLKALLGPELLKQQPDSKMEKADILEMTVCFLLQLMQQNQQQRRELNQAKQAEADFDDKLKDPGIVLNTCQTIKDEEKNPKVLWRPW
ncbi:PREDICTED: transcription factor HES-4-like [Cyprinodon variegatus]|nr:PREDICTED: transcription factor HES-4-like [Cyprinodon variegatus]